MIPSPRSQTRVYPSRPRAPERPSDADIGAALRRMRLSSGLTQSEVASALGVTYQQVQNYEKGAARVAASTLKAAVDFFDVSVAAVFAEVERLSEIERARRNPPDRDEPYAAGAEGGA